MGGVKRTIWFTWILLAAIGVFQEVSSQGNIAPSKEILRKEPGQKENSLMENNEQEKLEEQRSNLANTQSQGRGKEDQPEKEEPVFKRKVDTQEVPIHEESKAVPVVKPRLSDNRPVEEDTFDATILIADRPECQSDLEESKACKELLRTNSNYRKNNLALISCLLSPDNEAESQGAEPRTLRISKACENMVWKYEVALTQNKAITNKIKSACQENEKALRSCFSVEITDTPANQGHILGCIIAKKDDPLIHWVESCKAVINQVEALVFGDYHLIGGFVEKCGADIARLECGRILQDEESYHSQGDVLACLSERPKSLAPDCKTEIFKIAEYQSEDYHLDRRLFLACQGDRRESCPDVKSGNGRIYQCLIKKKFDPKMSKNCQRQLTRRQKLIALDYKASKGIYKSCFSEVKENMCFDNLSSSTPHVQLSEVLLCLEGVARTKKKAISPPCLTQIDAHRRMIMEDYRISPEIMYSCKDDIQASCADMGPGGNTIHCLMQLASKRELQNRDCLIAVKTLIKTGDVASDWKVDPILRKNCQDVVNSGCSQEDDDNNGSVVSCLMTLAGKNSRHMTQDCLNTLMEVQYFLARDFSLTPKLYTRCLSDAKKLCYAEDDWHIKASKNNDEDVDNNKLIFPCLVRFLYPEEDDDNNHNDNDGDNELSDECADQVVRVLEQRAISVNLHPEIEENCRGHLVYLCNNKTQQGAEFQCLQENFQSLDQECQESIRTYTKFQAKDTHLNTPVMISCHEVIESECKRDVKRDDNGELMRCLIKYKLEHEEEPSSLMTRKCAAIVEHWQILSMNDWHFSTKFKDSCRKSVEEHCQPVPQSKAEVLRCLSDIIQEDFIINKKPRIPKPCRMELKFNLLQKHSDIKLNPNLVANCHEELDTVCRNDRSLECLKKLPHQSISPPCRRIIFRQEKEEIMMNSIDPVIARMCGNEIKTHCSDTNGDANSILNCLKENQSSLNFDRACGGLVIQRIIQQMKDYRLNPRLQQGCATDLPQHCSHIMLLEEDGMAEDFMEGKVIECLKDRLRKQRNSLTPHCQKEIINLMRQSSVDIRAKPLVIQKCPFSVETCKRQLNIPTGNTDDDGQMEECLKKLFIEKKVTQNGDSEECMKELAKIIEDERQDINMDQALHRSCGLDVAKFCHDVSSSELGQKISCLKNVYEDPKLKLEPSCAQILGERLKMYNMALEIVPLQSVSQLLEHVNKSPSRNHFFLVGLLLVGMIFLVGIMCGRTTRRLHRELKSK